MAEKSSANKAKHQPQSTSRFRFSKKILIGVIFIGVLYVSIFFSRQIVKFVMSPVQTIQNVFVRSGNYIGVETDKNDQKIVVKVVDEQSAVIDVVKNASPAVVSVVRNDIYYDIRVGPVAQENSIGTGFIIDGTLGIILTNKHVVDDQDVKYSVVYGENESRYDVTVVSRDPINDFAILKIDTQGNKLQQLELGDSDKIQVGQTVVAIGNALGEFGNSVTKGIVSGLGRGIYAQSGMFGSAEYLDNVIQTDAALNPGNSGGPLLNLESQVIGINVAISQGAENIGFSIPINTLKQAITSFKTQGKITRPYLGVEFRNITADIADTRKLPIGAFVQRVVKDSPADLGGIRAGDIILVANDIKLDDKTNTLNKVIANSPTDRDIRFVVDRDGEEINLNIRLESTY